MRWLGCIHRLLITVPQEFKIEKMVGGLNLPTTVTWDDQGMLYVVEAGGAWKRKNMPLCRL